MNQLSVQDRVQILHCLSEGMGVNATARVTGKSKNTILKLLADVGTACTMYQDRVMNNLPCKRFNRERDIALQAGVDLRLLALTAQSTSRRMDTGGFPEWPGCHTWPERG